jgi:hypothetical protein
VRGQAISTTGYYMANAAVSGCGLAFLTENLAAPYLADGRLVSVMQDWCPKFPGLHAYYPAAGIRHARSARSSTQSGTKACASTPAFTHNSLFVYSKMGTGAVQTMPCTQTWRRTLSASLNTVPVPRASLAGRQRIGANVPPGSLFMNPDHMLMSFSLSIFH